MNEEAIQQIASAVAKIELNLESLRADFNGLRADVNSAEQEAKQRDETLSKEMRKLRERGSRDWDQMEMLKNQVQGFMALGGGRGPEPVQYVPTGTGLVDPEWRWEREHPFRR